MTAVMHCILKYCIGKRCTEFVIRLSIPSIFSMVKMDNQLVFEPVFFNKIHSSESQNRDPMMPKTAQDPYK